MKYNHFIFAHTSAHAAATGMTIPEGFSRIIPDTMASKAAGRALTSNKAASVNSVRIDHFPFSEMGDEARDVMALAISCSECNAPS